ncbi:Panacea domain-containing protein [Mesorhizobium sp.]|uniref:Panacea domain-containing protein n=1 Tax=Mesorhizobium sp. TaxID=1871066 RepID=UPI00257A8A82|nr:Panacea domain-containing protein [Mesorhizobium sp.]
MFVSREREKLENAAIFFIEKTRRCHTMKLMKLLNFLDFEHFRQTGRTVTGQRYKAWDKGPVPSRLWKEIESGGSIGDAVSVIQETDPITKKAIKRTLKPRKAFDRSLFTRRELQIMDRLAEFFVETKGDDMSEFSHMKGLPWRKVYGKGEGNNEWIPEELAFGSEPIVGERETIDPEEYAYRKTVLG